VTMTTIRAAGAALVAALALASLPALASASPAATEPDASEAIYLVTLDGPGTSGTHTDLLAAARMRSEQDAVLDEVGSPEPVYRWTTALNGVAVQLSAVEATDLRTDPRVALVERNAVRSLAGRSATTGLLGTPARARGGAGVVVGVVDSGIWPDSPLFSTVTGLGRSPRGFTGGCETGEGWPATACDDKLLGARWFVSGFGADRLRSSSSLSPLDDDGHGTQVASIIAGNAGVPARVGSQRLGAYAGVAPQARLAVYKACWSAPDPADDGCSTADLVAAIDAATADGVDVLNLSVGGPPRIDTVERALLGATEGGVVVVGAAGNTARSPGRSPQPAGSRRSGDHRPGTAWARAAARRNVVRRRDGRGAHGRARARGARRRRPGRHRHSARGAGVHARQPGRPPGRRPDRGLRARRRRPGGQVRGRGPRGRRGHGADERRARRSRRGLPPGADGARRPSGRAGPAALGRDAPRGTGAARAARAGPHPRAGDQVVQRRHARLPSGQARRGRHRRRCPRSGAAERLCRPLGPDHRDVRGGGIHERVAALVRSAHEDWTPARVRSALATTALRVPGAAVLRSGTGRVSLAGAARPGLSFDVAPDDYRAWLEGDLTELNTPSIRVSGPGTVQRTVTNVTGRRLYFSSSATGFERRTVRVTPAAVRLGPGESATFTLTVGAGRGLDDGWVTWRGATGTVTRVPVLVTG